MSLDKTNYVSKDKLRVRVETTRERILGFVHVLYRHRASDLLNDDSRFVPITDAVISMVGSDAPPNHVPFLAINKDHIVTLYEETEGSK
ncbi:MAG: hypothetical protein NTX50_00370 [Candidatus Sumerlaeota bacterium]|nr:hypothetical protein [Candidatus Sumerlaeota bacterium]